MTWAGFKREVSEVGKWFVTSLVFVRDQFTFLKGEHIRSLAFLYVCWQGERSWSKVPEGTSLISLEFNSAVAMLCLVSAIGLAWQATSAKLKIAQFQMELGRDVTAGDGLFAGDSDAMRAQMKPAGEDY